MSTFTRYIDRLIAGESLNYTEIRECFIRILLNKETELCQGAFLAALTAKGASVTEIKAAWETIMELDTNRVEIAAAVPVADNSGTGMDCLKTFNISTLAAITAAANGACIARHGSRAITSSCGTVDLVEALGVEVECSADTVRQSVENCGLGIFNGASTKIHPRALGRILSQAGFGSVLNIAASLANPAAPRRAVRGVCSREMVAKVAGIMAEMGFERAIVFCGLDGHGNPVVDEASTLGGTYCVEVCAGQISSYTLVPEEVGLQRCLPEDIAFYGSKDDNICRAVRILRGQGTQAENEIVAYNAGLLLYVSDLCTSLHEGVQRSLTTLQDGGAYEKCRQWVAAQTSDPDASVHHFLQLKGA